MKNSFLIILLLIFGTNVSSQNESIKDLVVASENLNLDMWELVEYAQKNIKKDSELARFFYYWIGTNIKYDYEFLKRMEQGVSTHQEYKDIQDEYRVYADRKGVCGGYANLFKWFMQEVDIEVALVSGHIRDERNHYVELELDDDFRHAWNAIKINEKWALVDSTWGTSLKKEVADFYFDIPPERAILSHFPEKSNWQLLEKPLTLAEFNKSKFVNPIWFKVGYSDIPKMKMDSKYYYFIFRSNPNEKWMVNLLYSVDNQNFRKLKELTRVIQEDYTILRFYKSIVPKKTFFKVNLFKSVGETDFSLWHSDVINFKM